MGGGGVCQGFQPNHHEEVPLDLLPFKRSRYWDGQFRLFDQRPLFDPTNGPLLVPCDMHLLCCCKSPGKKPKFYIPSLQMCCCLHHSEKNSQTIAKSPKVAHGWPENVSLSGMFLHRVFSGFFGETRPTLLGRSGRDWPERRSVWFFFICPRRNGTIWKLADVRFPRWIIMVYCEKKLVLVHAANAWPKYRCLCKFV